jgi:addiction module RelE/StbE family toxin
MKIIWTKTAKVTFEAIFSYLKENFSDKTVENFVDETEKKIDQIKKFPESGKKVTKVKGVRKVNIGKRTSMYYRVKTKFITILSFFDTRQDPDKNKY